LAEISTDHLDMVGHYTSYWRRNRAVLLDGEFQARGPLANYPLVSAYDPDKLIVVTYAEVNVSLGERPVGERPVGERPLRELPARSRIDVVNATPGGRVVLDVRTPLGEHRYRILDALGRELSAGRVSLVRGALAFDVPVAGILELVRSSSE
jgi:alpha-galactosidase